VDRRPRETVFVHDSLEGYLPLIPHDERHRTIRATRHTTPESKSAIPPMAMTI
jgi:hypothetical protein